MTLDDTSCTNLHEFLDLEVAWELAKFVVRPRDLSLKLGKNSGLRQLNRRELGHKTAVGSKMNA